VPLRVLSGTYMSSLNEIGFSVSLLKVVELSGKSGERFSMLDLLHASVEAAGWSASVVTRP
jgi:dihydroxyacetone kinase